jgi:Holliday junction resolvase
MTPEARTKAAIVKWLKARSIWYFMPVSNGMGRHGIPDFICCWGGKFLAIEAKAAGKRANTSALQEREIEAIRSARGWAVVIDDVSQLDEYFKEFENAQVFPA